jgi:WD40 repeat protein
MTSPPSSVGGRLPPGLGRQLDRMCDLFERRWRAGQRPRIEEFLSDATEPMRSQLLGELLALEVTYRQRQGEAVSLDEYRSRFPRDAAVIEAALGGDTPATDVDGLPTRARPDSSPTLTPAQLGGSALTGDGTRFGDYELCDVLGVGGMGVVYRARQVSADRLVAVKLIRLEQLTGLSGERRREWLERFRSEGQAAARLAHDHVVTVYEVGDWGGQPFYSMRYLDGPSLVQVLRQGPVPGRRAAALLEPVARAVQHAHERGILHRDLKPGNILLDTAGRPFVTDFGLAKWTAEPRGMTQPGAVLGSPFYMSPEQVVDSARVTAASDVYSLGATLYELLTGRPPFQAATPLEVLHLVLEQEPVPPRRLNPALDRDLETVTLKCLHREPKRRYQSAADLADDLRRYLDGRPVRARRVGAPERLRRWARRRPLVAGLSAAVLLLVLATAASLLAGYRNTAVARHEAEVQRDEARTHLRAALLAQAAATRQGTEPGRRREALRALRQAAGLGPGPDLRAEYLRCLDLPDLQAVADLPGAAPALAGLPPGCWPVGEALAVSPRGGLRRVEPGGVMEYDLASGRASRLPTGAGQFAWPWALSADGGLLAARRQERRETCVWDLAADKLHGVLTDGAGGPFAACCVAFSDRSGRLAAAYETPGPRPGLDRRYRICVYDARSLRAVAAWSLEAPGLDCLCFAPSGDLLAARTGTPTRGQDADVICLWSLPDGKDAGTLYLEEGTGWDYALRAPRRIAFSADGRFLAAVKRSVKLWDLSAGPRPGDARPVLALSPEGTPADAVYLSADARWLAVTDRGGEVKVWDARTGRLAVRTPLDAAPLPAPDDTGEALAPSLLATAPPAAAASGLRLWRFEQPPVRRFAPPPGARGTYARRQLQALAGSPDGRWLAYGLAADGSPYLLDLHAATAAPVPLGNAGAGPLAFSADGGRLWAAPGGRHWTWQLPGREPAAEGGPSVLAVAFDARGRRVTAAAADGVLTVGPVAAGDECLRLEDPDRDVKDPGLHDERLPRHFGLGLEGGCCALVQVEGGSARVRMFDVPARRELFAAAVPASASCVAVAERTGLVAVGAGTRVHVFEAETRSEVAVLEGHRGEVADVAFDSSGEVLASVSAADGTVRLWAARTGTPLAVWHTEQERPGRVALGPGGRWLATLDARGALSVWDVDAARRQLRQAGLDWE